MKSLPAITREASADLPTKWGNFVAHGYTSPQTATPYLALTLGDVTATSSVLVRVHSCCATGDIFGSLRCDCGQQRDLAMREIANEGCGILIYATDHEGRGIGLVEKLRAYKLQDEGLDTIDANLALGHGADERDYGFAAAILADLGTTIVRLMTNNPAKIAALEAFGITCQQVPLIVAPTEFDRAYLETKRLRGGHLLPIEGVA